MRRALRRWLAALGALLALLLLAVVSLPWWLDPDLLRPALEAQARARFGLALHLEGPLRWQLWPALAVQTGPGTLGTDHQEDLLRWQDLRFTLRWPGRHAMTWQFDGLAIDGLRVQLQADAAGRWNLAELGDAISAHDAGRMGGIVAPRAVRIQPLQLRDADIAVRTAPGARLWHMTHVNANADLDASAGIQAWTLAGLRFTGHLGAASLQVNAAGPLHWQPLRGAGTLRFESAALRDVLAALDVSLPPTRDAGVLRDASLEAQWALDEAEVRLEVLQLRLDDTRLQGRVLGRWREPRDWQVVLQGDALNLDRYRRPDSDPGEPFRLPWATLRALSLNGSVRLQRLTAGGTVARDARIELHSAVPAGAVRRP